MIRSTQEQDVVTVLDYFYAHPHRGTSAAYVMKTCHLSPRRWQAVRRVLLDKGLVRQSGRYYEIEGR